MSDTQEATVRIEWAHSATDIETPHVVRFREPFATGPSHTFKLVDDDRETLLSGRVKVSESDEELFFETLFHWGMGMFGTTVLFIDGEALIG